MAMRKVGAPARNTTDGNIVSNLDEDKRPEPKKDDTKKDEA